jgi:hypothetical protein
VLRTSSVRSVPRRLTRLAALAALALVAACIAPTLPVPPPVAPDVGAPDASGQVVVTGPKGSVTGSSEVTVWNESYAESTACKADPYCNPGVVRIANPDGSYAVHIGAKSKDLLYVWQTVGNQQSGQTEVKVP